MANLANLDFVALDIPKKNYLTWVVDAKIHLEVGNLGETIKAENSAFSHDWVKTHLRIQDFKSVAEYNSTMFRISSQMKLCGKTFTKEDMLEKTFSTFDASKVLLQQYKERGFIEYNQLISVVLVTEQNSELLMKNHQSRLTGSTPFPEMNDFSLKVTITSSHGNNYKRGRGNKRGRWNGKGKNHGVKFHNQVPKHNSGPSFKNT
ncbi:uncharacterized protein [Pyrus communis]|uniref:uncharacterized protein n=1 Tax=Pyrus communis TaxID=23211 RepID=UPI0035C15B90